MKCTHQLYVFVTYCVPKLVNFLQDNRPDHIAVNIIFHTICITLLIFHWRTLQKNIPGIWHWLYVIIWHVTYCKVCIGHVFSWKIQFHTLPIVNSPLSVCHPLLSFVAYSEWGCIEHEEERWFNVTYQGAQFRQTNGRHKWVITSYLVTLSTNVTVAVLFSSFGPKFQQTNGITLCLPLTPIYLINWSG